MNYKATKTNFLFNKSFLTFTLKPASAWTAILLLIFIIALSILIGAGKILNWVFPVGSFAVGILLYFQAPNLYVGFTWWMFFLTPLIRRLADYQSTYTEPSPILLAPYLVVLISFISLWQNLPKFYRQGGLPYILSLGGLCYGFLLGLIQRQSISVSISLLDWIVPILFSCYLFIHWQDYPLYRQTIKQVFTWGVLIMGIYGIMQYLFVPEWDKLWTINSGLITSTGQPTPLNLRIWSTLNSPGSFANMMKAGLLLLFTNKSILRFPTAAVGYLAFLLSMVRAAWSGWLVGLISLTVSLKSNLQIRLFITILAVFLCVTPLVVLDSFSERINDRIETFSNLEADSSAQGRKEHYIKQMDVILTSPLGQGIGGKGNDSAILDIFLSLGWFGSLLYLSGIIILAFSLFSNFPVSSDLFAYAARAIVLSSLFQMSLGPVMIEVNGMILWGFFGISMAAKKYHIYQSKVTRR